MKAFVVALAVGGLALGGCTNSTPNTNKSPTTTTPDTGRVSGAPHTHLSEVDQSILQKSQTSQSAPQEFRDRSKLAGCGEVALTATGRLHSQQFNCLASSGDTGGAELVVIFRTVEGDPIVRYYRAGPSIHDVEIFSDETLDKFGTRKWRHESTTLDRLKKAGV
jgi:hypothetical protein